MRRALAVLTVLLLLMAHTATAAIITPHTGAFGVGIMRAQLLTDQVATTDGEWIDISGLLHMSLHIKGITNATVEIDGSNEATRPANNTHGIKLNPSDLTADQMVFLGPTPMRWLKVRVPAYVSGTINVYFEGHAR